MRIALSLASYAAFALLSPAILQAQTVTGSGTADSLPMWRTNSTLGNSIISLTGTNELTVDGSLEAITTSGIGLEGTSASGFGVEGASKDNSGVVGSSTSGTGVSGHTGSGYGVQGQSNSSTGVFGISDSGFGVAGSSISNAGVEGTSNNNSGVLGNSKSGSGVHRRRVIPRTMWVSNRGTLSRPVLRGTLRIITPRRASTSPINIRTSSRTPFRWRQARGHSLCPTTIKSVFSLCRWQKRIQS